ncbi:2OG-Fe dioxygenase domain-containing protein [Trichoderma compactum]
MSSFRSAQRAVRASAPLLRSSPLITNWGSQRLFHESSKAKAVEAIATQTPLSNGPPPPPYVAQQVQQQQQQLISQPTPQVEGYTQLNVRDQAYKPKFYETIGKIMKLREKYLRDRAIFVESEEMLALMLGLGAKESDIPGMKAVSDKLYHDPTLPFRLTRNSRFCLDFDTHSIRRLEFQPFCLTVEEDFNRYDSGAIRRFDEVQNDLQLNSIFQALFVFKAMIIHGMEIAHRPKLEYGINKWVCTLFSLRTVTTPHILGEPALEGVHSDGVDHTMTTFLGSYNMSDNSAATFMHDMEEKTGIPLEQIQPIHLVGRVQHKRFLDTLMVVDHERKHSLSPVFPVDKTKEAHRDMLVFFTRKPVEQTHVSGGIDSLNPHKDLPMEIPLYLPGAN